MNRVGFAERGNDLGQREGMRESRQREREQAKRSGRPANSRQRDSDPARQGNEIVDREKKGENVRSPKKLHRDIASCNPTNVEMRKPSKRKRISIPACAQNDPDRNGIGKGPPCVGVDSGG